MSNTKRPARSFRLHVQKRANELFGAVDYAEIDTLTERDGGLQVDTVASGHVEGDRFSRSSSRFVEGVDFDSAVAYRLSQGYVEIKAAA